MLVTCIYSAPGSLVGDRLCLLYSASGEDVTVPALLLDLYSGGLPGHAPESEADNLVWGFAYLVAITLRPKTNLHNRTAHIDPGLGQVAPADALFLQESAGRHQCMPQTIQQNLPASCTEHASANSRNLTRETPNY